MTSALVSPMARHVAVGMTSHAILRYRVRYLKSPYVPGAMELRGPAAARPSSVAQAALSPDAGPGRIVDGLAARARRRPRPHLADGPGDVCDDCRLRPECPEPDALPAPGGQRRQLPRRPGGAGLGPTARFRRFPLGVRKVGHGRRERRAAAPARRGTDDRVAGGPDWAQREGIVCFAGQPLIFRGEDPSASWPSSAAKEVTSEEEFGWLRTFADHAAVRRWPTAAPSRRSRSSAASWSSSATTCARRSRSSRPSAASSERAPRSGRSSTRSRSSRRPRPRS